MLVGSNKMKNIASIIYILFIAASFDNSAEAQVKKTYKVDAKCHVVLTSDKEVIYFARVKEADIKKLLDTLPKRKVLTSLSKDKQQIQKVFECVPLTAKFSSLKANRLFKSQAR
mgnify:FL=1